MARLRSAMTRWSNSWIARLSTRRGESVAQAGLGQQSVGGIGQRDGSSTGTVRPVSSCWLTQDTPLWGMRVLITGQPLAIASTCTKPNASLRAFEGNQKASAAR